MQNIGALQESLTVGSNQQMLKARLKRWVFNRFLKSTESETARMSSGIERSTRQGQREKRHALHILSVAAASRSSLLKKIVGRRVNDWGRQASRCWIGSPDTSRERRGRLLTSVFPWNIYGICNPNPSASEWMAWVIVHGEISWTASSCVNERTEGSKWNDGLSLH